MKLSTYFGIAALAAVTPFATAASTLQEKWAIGENPSFTYDSLDFTLTFSITDFIVKNQAQYSLWTDECQEGGVELGTGSGLTGSLTDTANTQRPSSGIATMNQAATISISVDPATIASNADIYSESDQPGDVTAQVVFCVRFGLYADTEEVNFLETVITLDVDLSDGFEIASIAVTPKDKLVRTAAQAYLVEGYVCTDEEIQGDLAAIRNQGAQIRVCVRPDADARADGVYMRRIDSFEWKRDTPTPITQEAVKDGRASSNTLTDLFCEPGELVCNFVSILFASFYATTGSVSGSGMASMQFGGDNSYIGQDGYQYSQNGAKFTSFYKRRNLRQLQDDADVAATSEFDLSFDVDQGTSTFDDSNSGASSVGTMAMSLVAIAGAVVLM